MSTQTPSDCAPLDGITILDLTRLLPTMHLADMGAEVIVVHRKSAATTPGKSDRNSSRAASSKASTYIPL